MTHCALVAISVAVQILAGVAQFEAGVCGPPGMRALVRVQLNQMASPWFPSTATEVAEERFAGWTRPSPEAIQIAALEYLAWHRGVKIPGFFFALSKADVKKLGFPPGDKVIRSGDWEVHLFRRWPQSRTVICKEASCKTVGQ